MLSVLGSLQHDITASYTHFRHTKQSDFCCTHCNILYFLTGLLSRTAAVFVFLFVSAFIFFHVLFFGGEDNQFRGKLVENQPFFPLFWPEVWGFLGVCASQGTRPLAARWSRICFDTRRHVSWSRRHLLKCLVLCWEDFRAAVRPGFTAWD